MNLKDMQARLARLQRECDVSAAPATLLCAACSVLVLMLTLSAVTYEMPPTQAQGPIEHLTHALDEVERGRTQLGLAAPADSSRGLKPATGSSQAIGVSR